MQRTSSQAPSEHGETMRSEQPFITVIAPVYNESRHLHELYRQVTETLRAITPHYEIILVDDGSRDNSVEIIEELRQQDPCVGLVQLSRNFGKEMAMLAGYDHSRGDAVIMMDADLQTPVSVIPKFIEKWQAGADIVDAVRTRTIGQSPLRTFASTAFYWILQHLAHTQIVPNSVDFRLMDAKAVAQLCNCREKFRFNRGLISWLGFKRAFVEFEAADRLDEAGSRWSTLRLFGYALDGVISFSSLPLRISGVMGLGISFLSLLYLVYLVLYRVFIGQPQPGYATVVGGIFLLGGIQLVTIWMLGEYVGRLYEESKGRPPYIAARFLQPDNPQGSDSPQTAKE